MQLVHGERRLVHGQFGAAGHPLLVAPHVVRLGDDRRGRGRDLGAAGHRVGAQRVRSVGPGDVELVERALADTGQEQLPHTGRAERTHRIDRAVPVVEVPGDPHPLRVRRPDGEAGARDALVDHRVGAERAPQLLVPALADEMQVEIAERGQEAVRVPRLDLVGVRPVRAVPHEQRVRRHLAPRQQSGEETVAVVVQRDAQVGADDRHGRRVRAQRADDHAAPGGVGAEDTVRVVVRPAEQPVPVGVRERRRGLYDGAAGTFAGPRGSGGVGTPGGARLRPVGGARRGPGRPHGLRGALRGRRARRARRCRSLRLPRLLPRLRSLPGAPGFAAPPALAGLPDFAALPGLPGSVPGVRFPGGSSRVRRASAGPVSPAGAGTPSAGRRGCGSEGFSDGGRGVTGLPPRRDDGERVSRWADGSAHRAPVAGGAAGTRWYRAVPGGTDVDRGRAVADGRRSRRGRCQGRWAARRWIAAIGTASQSGRFLASYSTSYTALSVSYARISAASSRGSTPAASA